MPRSQRMPPKREGVFSKTVTLINAQIKALPTTPFLIVPALGVKKILLPFQALLSLKWYDDYSTINAAAILVISDPDKANQCLAHLDEASSQVSGLLASGGDSHAVLNQRPVIVSSVPLGLVLDTDLENSGLYLNAINADGDFTDGHANNALMVTIFYSLIER